MTMTTTREVRPMDEIGAADIAIGQRWAHVVTEKARQRVYWLTAIDGDKARMIEAVTPQMPSAFSDDMTVSFGSLLSDWVLVGEA